MTQCNYKPSQGIYKGQPCLLDTDQYGEHEGPHIYDPAKVPKAAAAAPPPADHVITDEEIASALSEEEIRRRSEAMDGAQEIWERAHYRAQPKMPCPECTGNGQVVGGSLGDHCPSCHGTRVVPDDSVEFEFEMPNFGTMRAALTAYGDALVWRRNGLPPGLHPKKVDEYKQKLVLPPASTVPTMEAIEAIREAGRQKHQQLAAGGAPAAPQLPAAGTKPQRSGFETEGGMEDTATDAEIDAIEAELAE